jgi:phage shock protein E
MRVDDDFRIRAKTASFEFDGEIRSAVPTISDKDAPRRPPVPALRRKSERKSQVRPSAHIREREPIEEFAMRRLFFPIGLLCLAGVVFAIHAQEHTKDSIDGVRKAVADKKAILLDVREQHEWDEGHLRDAKLLPLSVLQKGADAKALAKALAKLLEKDKVIYAHCRSGRRCLEAADILRKLGYDVRALKPGYQQLLDAGFPKADK